MPIRIRRRRTAGWRMPPNTTYVGRPTRWGNPYFPGCGIGYGYFDENMRPVDYNDRDPAQCVLMFRFRMRDMERDRPAEFRDFMVPLIGCDLACWCPLSSPCHADILLELANRVLLELNNMAPSAGLEPATGGVEIRGSSN